MWQYSWSCLFFKNSMHPKSFLYKEKYTTENYKTLSSFCNLEEKKVKPKRRTLYHYSISWFFLFFDFLEIKMW